MENRRIIKLNNGVEIPQIGLGVYKVPPEEAFNTVKSALEVGYRHIDTASFYANEEEVGRAIRSSGLKREDIFVTTKVWNDEQGYDSTLKTLDESLERLQMDYVDLYLIHWPVPDLFTETWRAFEKLYEMGKVRAIGVSNFLEHHLKELLSSAKVIPAVNQIELHPKLVEKKTIDFCTDNQIKMQAWSPLGRAKYLDDPVIVDLAKKHEKTPAQIVIRWHLQNDFIVIPKSTKLERQKENISVFDFELTDEDMNAMNSLEEGYRIGSHPDNIPL